MQCFNVTCVCVYLCSMDFSYLYVAMLGAKSVYVYYIESDKGLTLVQVCNVIARTNYFKLEPILIGGHFFCLCVDEVGGIGV
jgi:hypothetical protein